MRKILNSMMLGLSAVLALVGCGGGVSNDDHSSVVIDSSAVIDSTVTEPDVITEWRSDDVTTMNTVLGLVLPVAPFSANYVSDLNVEDPQETIVYFYDETIEDRREAYGEILEANGYVANGTSDQLGYDVFFYYYRIPNDGVDDFVHVQVDYFPGNDRYSAAFEVFAWFEDCGDIFTEWPEEALAEAIDTTETVPSFAADRYHFRYLSSRECHVIYGYTSDATVEATYTSILEGAGWTIDNSRYDDGYGIYADSPGGELRLQYAFVKNDEDDSRDMMVLFIYVNDAEEDTPSE